MTFYFVGACNTRDVKGEQNLRSKFNNFNNFVFLMNVFCFYGFFWNSQLFLFFLNGKTKKYLVLKPLKKKIEETVNLTLCVLRLLPPHVSLSVLLALLMNYYNITDVENCEQGL